MKFLFQLSGEHPHLPKAEILGVLEGEKLEYCLLEEENKNRLLILDVKTKNLDFLSRVALTKKAAEFISKEQEISKAAVKIYEKISKAKTFAVRSSSQKIEKKLGEGVKNLGLKVNLKNPDVEILCLPILGRYYAGIAIPLKKDFEKRKPQFRLYFSPTSLHPKLARVLVNLAKVKKGDAILDPFCGTGGILIEAALMGMEVIGIDFDEKAAEGCRKNLDFYGLGGRIRRGDALSLELNEKVDAIVTDLPYGRSSFLTRGREKNLKDFYEKFLLNAERNLKINGHVVMVIPDRYKLKFEDGFSIEDTYKIYVHKSLSRRILVLKRESEK